MAHTSLEPSGGNPIDGWLTELHQNLDAHRRVRARRIVAEAEEHLRDTADDLESGGMAPSDAAQAAVDRFGTPGEYAERFRSPTGFDWAVDTAHTVLPVIGWLLVALGAIATFVASVDWVLGHPVRGHGVRVWRTCPESADGQCIGPFHEYYASSTLIAGVALIIIGLIVVLVALLLRRRYSGRELLPRWVFWAGDGLLAALGLYLVIGGAIRSSLDQSWYWVPFWAVAAMLCLVIAGLAARRELRTVGREATRR